MLDAATKSESIISVSLITKYQAFLRPMVNVLQSNDMDVLQCANHKEITDIRRKNYGNAVLESQNVLAEAETFVKQLRIDFNICNPIRYQRILEFTIYPVYRCIKDVSGTMFN